MGTKVSRKHHHAGLEVSEHRVAISDYNKVPEAACHKLEFLGCHSARQHLFDSLKLCEQSTNAGFVF